jgi:hypothetical protein
MEAARFGFDFPPAYKFDPTDADLVAHYLLPRAIGFPNPKAHAIIDDDPCSCPPWELLRRHGHEGSDQAFFFGPPRDPAGRARRAVRPGLGGGGGGLWRGQKATEADLVVFRRGGGAQLKLRFRRNNLSYQHNGDANTRGWVMHEYHILHPKPHPGAVLSRIRITDKAKKKKQLAARAKKQQQHAAADQQHVPGPEQPGLSNYPGGASSENSF